MTSEVFEGDFEEMSAENSRLWCSLDKWPRQECPDGEQGPPSAQAEINVSVFIEFRDLFGKSLELRESSARKF